MACRASGTGQTGASPVSTKKDPMFERLNQLEARYEELTNALASPDIVSDSARYQKTAKAHSEITPTVEK